MQAGRRYWEVAAIGVLLACLAVVLERASLALGAVGIGAWLLTRQFAFLQALSAVRSGLTVEQELERDRAFTDETVPVSLSARLRTTSPLAVRVDSEPPVATRAAPRGGRAVRLAPGETAAGATYTVESPIAGDYEFDPPTVAVTDTTGLLRAEFPHGPSERFTVEPRQPRRIHVGEGGSRSASMAGAHRSSDHGEGIDFATLRQYVAGDPAHRIDWKATARLGEAYVHEYETESDRETVLLFDRRGSLAQGPDGERKIDYLREVATVVAKGAQDYNDPVGLYAVGDEGPTERVRPSVRDGHYRELRRTLRELESSSSSNGNWTQSSRSTADRRLDDRLYGEDSAYAATLRPYLESATRSLPEFAERPLLGTAESMRAELGDTDWSVVFTDDTAKAEVLETANRLRRGESRVTIFLAPSVFFEAGGLADVERAYSRYREFEGFRRRLAGLERVAAFEVAPGDRAEAIFREHRRRRQLTS